MQPPSEQDLRVTVRTLKYLNPGLTARELGNTLKKDHKWVLRWWGREDQENAPRGQSASKTLTPTKLSFIKRRVCGTQGLKPLCMTGSEWVHHMYTKLVNREVMISF